MIKTALLSVYHKEGIVDFAKNLIKLGWKILASGGTAKYLKESGVPATDVAEIVGGGPILGHRVVTLSREIHAGLLSRNNTEDNAELSRLGITRIDLVCCDLYPLIEEIANPNHTIESVIEKTDIGGPTILSSAAKGGRIVICDPNDRQKVLEALKASNEIDAHFRRYLRAKADAIVAEYRLTSARFHSNGAFNGLIGSAIRTLAYGENLDQSPAFLHSSETDNPLAWKNFKILSSDPSFINMADGDRTLQILCLMAEVFRKNFPGKSLPYIAIACKHGNPCGAAIDWENPAIALINSLLGDHIAIMGAEIMTNFPITEEIGKVLFRVSDALQEKVGREYWGVDVVFAPAFDQKSVELLGKKERRRLLANPALSNPQMSKQEWIIRPVLGGFLRQKAPQFVLDFNSVEWTQNNTLSKNDLSSLIIAWATAWRSNSNTIMIVKDNMLIGPGVGQKDRTGCCQIALWYAKRAGHETKGSVFASDGFFPYAKKSRAEGPSEAPELLKEAGCIAGIVPADGKKLEEVKEFFREAQIQVALLPKEHRGFSQH